MFCSQFDIWKLCGSCNRLPTTASFYNIYITMLTFLVCLQTAFHLQLKITGLYYMSLYHHLYTCSHKHSCSKFTETDTSIFQIVLNDSLCLCFHFFWLLSIRTFFCFLSWHLSLFFLITIDIWVVRHALGHLPERL